jgi:hypothetical protein
MMKTLLKTLLIVLTLSNCSGQTKIIYHSFEPTASDYAITKWNISHLNLPKYYVKETVDNKGRVTELKFFEAKSIIKNGLCYLSPWIKFEYPNDSTIVEYELDGAGNKLTSLECPMPYKAIYHLTKDLKIIKKTEEEYYFDRALYLKNGWTNQEINSSMKDIEQEKNSGTYPIVGGFLKSWSKLNGKLPISKDFILSKFYINQVEKNELVKALNKK